MAKPNTQEEAPGMDKADIKRHLRIAREAPVTVAFAIGRDGKAILQFDRHKQGRALEKQIKDAAPESKTHRYGTALVDPNDEKTVVFTVNKAGGGLAKKLIVALKGSGFSKVKIQLDDGSEVEALEEQDESEAEEGGAAAAGAAVAASSERPVGPAEQAAPQAAAAAPTPTADAAKAAGAAPEAAPAAADTGASAAEAAAPAPPQAAAQPSAAALAKDLTELVKRMLAVISKDATQKAALTELATDAQASLKRGDLEQASAGIDIFREAVSDCEAAIAGGATAKGAPNGAATNGAAAPAAAASAPHGQEHAGHATNGATKPNGAAPPAPDLRREAEAILGALTNAVKQAVPLVTAIPGLGDLIKTVAPAVQSAVKAGQHDEARSILQKLLDAVTGGAPSAALGQAAGAAAHTPEHDHREHAAKHAPAIEKAGHVWSATRDKVMGEVQKLEKAFTSALDGHGMVNDLTKTLRTKVEDTLQHLDDRLMHALADVNKAGDAAERAKHVEHAHQLVQHYQKHVGADATIKMLDRNPFHPLAIEKTVMASLAALEKSIH